MEYLLNTRWREDMNFVLEWQEQYLTSERSEYELILDLNTEKITDFDLNHLIP